jgi:dienelactone hydrolase
MKYISDRDIDIDEDRDRPLEREYTDEGVTCIVYPTDPHGFWRIKLAKKTKTLPSRLDGSFTGISEAEKAVKGYFAELKLGAIPMAKNKETLIATSSD